MSARARLVLVVVGLIALCATVLAAMAASSQDSDEPAAVVEGPESPFEGAVRPKALRGDFSLRNQDGELVRTSDLRGKVVVTTPTYTTCDESCPIAVQQVRGAIDDLEAGDRERVRAFALSVDPDNDTPDKAQEFLLSRRVRGYLDYLLGSRRELQPVWREYGFAPQTETQEHNSYVVLLDGDARQRVGFPVEFLTPEALTHDIELLLKGGADGAPAKGID
jgi:protein SCO1